MAKRWLVIALGLIDAGVLTLLALRVSRLRRPAHFVSGAQTQTETRRSWGGKREVAILVAACVVAAGLVATPAVASTSNAPQVASLTPTGGPSAGGNLVTIAGSNFCGTKTIQFGSGRSAPDFVVNSNGTAIAVDAPPGTGTVDVQVTTPSGASPTSPSDRYTYQPPPETPYSGAKLALSPSVAGPDTPHFPQTLTATLTDRFGKPLPNMVLPFTVTGAHPTTGSANTNANGVATFTYAGASPGKDNVTASFTAGNDSAKSNSSTVTWASPGAIATVSTDAVAGNFYPEDPSATSFIAKPGDAPAFQQNFPNVNFNPPTSVLGVNDTTRPFTDVTTDVAGNVNGTIAAQGNGVQAGVASMTSFDAEFESAFVVAKPGDVTFSVTADDGFLLGIGGGATRVNGTYENVPPSNTSPFKGYPLVGGFNLQGGATPQTFYETVHFPTAGSYPYELDYSECCGSNLSLALGIASFNPETSPLSIYVGYADGLRPAGSVFPFPWNGSPDVTFVGGGTYDSGAIRFDNSSDAAITLDSVLVDVGSTHYDIFPRQLVVAPHQILILAQTSGENFDSSDVSGSGCGNNNGVIPQVSVTVKGTATSYADTTQALNTHGYDLACQGNESIPWTRLGGGGTPINTPLPPAVTLNLSPRTGTRVVGQTQSVTVAALDSTGQPVAQLPVTLTLAGANGQQLAKNTDAAGTVTFGYVGRSAGTDTLSATAFIQGLRAASNSATITWNIPIPGGPPTGGTAAQAPPAITALSPPSGSLVTAPTPISATLTPPAGQSIKAWTVTERPDAPGGLPKTIASGTGAPPATLATFDPTLLPNGTYSISVTATGSGGGIQTVTTSVAVTGNLKLGRFTTTYQDLSVPVGGFQMEVRRTYDSTDKTVGDFGVGWRLSLANFRVTTNRELGAGGWSQYAPACFGALCLTAYKTSAPHFVTVTEPGGHTDVFDFTPTGGSVLLPTVGPGFTARPGTGTTATLSTSEGIQGMTSNGDLVGGNGTPYDPQTFTLTTVSGQVFALNRAAGLVSMSDRAGNTLTVDAAGVHSSDGRSLIFARDSSARVTDVTGPNGEHLHYAYTAAGDLGDSVDARGSTTTYSYNTSQELTGAIGANSKPLSRQTYDNSGRLVSSADGDGNTIAISNDVGARTQTVTDPNGSLTTVATYDAAGDLIQEDQALGSTHLTRKQTFDADGRPLAVTDPLGHTTQFTYDNLGNVARLTDPTGASTSTSYNATGDVLTTTNPAGATQSFTYDVQGHLLTQGRPDGGTTTLVYNSAGQAQTVTRADGTAATFTYDTNGYPATVTGPDGSVTKTTDDAEGHLTSVVGPSGAKTSFAYDSSGALTATTDPLNHTKTYAYDGGGHLVQAVDALGRATKTTYDDAGNVIRRTLPSGRTITYSYDVDGRLTEVQGQGATTVTYKRDALGRLTKATDAEATTVFTYDANGNVITQADAPGQTTTFAYDGDGRVTSEGGANYGYDASGNISSITDPSGTIIGGHSVLGQPTAVAYPGGLQQTMSYAASGLETGSDLKANGAPLSSLAYTRDSDGRVTNRSITGGVASGTTTRYAYDLEGRLTGATSSPQTPTGDERYAYDQAGNRITERSGSLQYDAAGQLTSDPTTRYTYDLDGRRITATAIATSQTTGYQWDSLGQLAAVTPPSGPRTTFGYDALNRRVTRSAPAGNSSYTWAGNNLSSITTGTSTTAFTTGAGMDGVVDQRTGTSTQYDATDAQRSVLAAAGTSNGLVGSAEYSSFGQTVASAGSVGSLGWIGRESDPSTGLIYLRSRYYDPNTGGFLSADPLGGGQPYAYAADAPTNLSDPSGAGFIELSQQIFLDTSLTTRGIGCFGGIAAFGFEAAVAAFAGKPIGPKSAAIGVTLGCVAGALAPALPTKAITEGNAIAGLGLFFGYSTAFGGLAGAVTNLVQQLVCSGPSHLDFGEVLTSGALGATAGFIGALFSGFGVAAASDSVPDTATNPFEGIQPTLDSNGFTGYTTGISAVTGGTYASIGDITGPPSC